MNIDGFKQKLFEKNLSVINIGKAKITFGIRQDAEDMLKVIVDILKNDSNVKRIKVNAIPYFIEDSF